MRVDFAEIILSRQFRRSSVCETPTHEINHTSAILVAFFLVLACVLQFVGKD
jgi:hypothetical protein